MLFVVTDSVAGEFDRLNSHVHETVVRQTTGKVRMANMGEGSSSLGAPALMHWA